MPVVATHLTSFHTGGALARSARMAAGAASRMTRLLVESALALDTKAGMRQALLVTSRCRRARAPGSCGATGP